MVVSSEILSEHLNLARYTPKAVDIPASKILSGPGIPPTQGSDGHMAPTLVPTKLPNGDIVYKNVTSANVFTITDFDKNGYASAQIDDGVARGQYHFPSFDRWKTGSGPSSSHEYISLPPKTRESGVAVSFGDKPWQAPEGQQTPLHNKHVSYIEVANWHNNKVGYAISIAENTRQALLRYLRTRDAQELVPYLKSLGYNPKNIEHIAVGFVPKGAIYGVIEIDGKVILLVAEDAYQILSREAKAFGIDVEDLRALAFAEEITHAYRGKKIGSLSELIQEERETKEIVRNHNKRLAKGADGGNPRDPRTYRTKRNYESRVKLVEEDIETVFRYRDLYLKDRESLELTLELEAYKKGYTDEGEVREYVASRMEKISKEVEGKSTSKLERVVEKEANSERTKAKAQDKAEAETSVTNE